MLRPTNADLLKVVDELARTTTPEELRSRGVRRVRSIGVDEIALLIEKAVNRTLMKRTIGALADAELDELVAETHDEFVAQLGELEALTDSRDLIERQREKLHNDLAAVREAIAAREGNAEDATARAEDDAERAKELRLRIQALLLPLYDARPNRPGVRRVAEQLMAIVEKDRQRALDEQRGAHEDELQLLQRRVTKLIASLENAERALSELAKLKDVEQGIASIYRTVQGLADGVLDREKKRDVLERLFQSNVTLRELVSRG